MRDTRKKIREAIEQLHAEGKRVTPTTVRDLVGSGSFSTITDEIEKWKLAQGAKPEETTEKVKELGLELVSLATAAGTLHKEHREHAPAVALARASLDFMHQHNAETLPLLMQMLHAALASHEALQLEFNAVNEENRRLHSEVARLTEQLASLAADSKKKLDAMMAGFDGIQKRLMLSVDQTRQQVQEPLRVLRDQNVTLQSQLNSKTQAFNELNRTVQTQAETIRNLERRLAEHEGHESL